MPSSLGRYFFGKSALKLQARIGYEIPRRYKRACGVDAIFKHIMLLGIADISGKHHDKRSANDTGRQ